MQSLKDWVEAVEARPRATATRTLLNPREAAKDSGSGCFNGLLDNEQFAWIKLPNSPHGARALANDVIINRFMRSVNAPTPTAELVRVSADLFNAWRTPAQWYGQPIRLHHDLIGHASYHVPTAIESKTNHFEHHTDDDNANRQALLAAMWDLFAGFDDQWLYDAANDHSIWSFDHGLWLYTEAFDWTPDLLQRKVREPNERPDDELLSPDALEVAAIGLSTVTHEQILNAICAVPVEWQIPNYDLGVLGWFINTRLPDVISRLYQRAETIRKR
ncbi:hypothetical protein PV375_01005 [Gulosibacter sp. GYB002]|uniref:hypothetical protein n=1 Tax=Gulosibacter sp. GYB002 TaxID=2994391 RepID=UPI002F969B3F